MKRLKTTEVPRTFINKVNEGRYKNEAKQTLWLEILKRTDKPQIEGARTMLKDSIKITTGNENIYQVLKDIVRDRNDFNLAVENFQW